MPTALCKGFAICAGIAPRIKNFPFFVKKWGKTYALKIENFTTSSVQKLLLSV